MVRRKSFIQIMNSDKRHFKYSYKDINSKILITWC